MPSCIRAASSLAVCLVVASVAARAQVSEPSSVTAGSPALGPAPPIQDAQQTSPAQPSPADLPRVRVGVLSYISFQAGDQLATSSLFAVKRTYLNVEADILPYLSARVTPDAVLTDDGLRFRVKYAYAQLKAGGGSIITAPTVQAGVVPTPWFPFEERVNRYRMQDPMFIERAGLLNSADAGVTVSGLVGGLLPEEVQRTAASHAPGRWGSFSFGVYNGGGYAAREANDNKVFEARLTGRPAPNALAGLQVSYLLIRGAGNTEAAPRWSEDLLMVSWEHPRAVVTGQFVTGDGNQAGSCAEDTGAAAWPHRGWSVFGEGRFGPRWSVMGRFDAFNRNTAGSADRFRRVIGGVAFHLGRNNILLADVDHRAWADVGRPDETRFQVTLQISF